MSQYSSVLKQADIFYNFTPTQLEMVANLCRERAYPSGGVIFPEEADSDELYIIIEGEVDILVNPALVSDQPGAGTSVVIATLRRGQSFGEIALVDRGLRSATARAVQNCRLLSIPRDALMALCDDYPQLGYRLLYNLAADLALKVRNTDLLIREELLYRPKK
jgi:CRP-like cAMP-binding protein